MEISIEQYNKMAEQLVGLKYMVAKMQWIPVTERLPEPYCGDVLVTVNDGSVYVDVMAYDSPGDGHTYNSVFYTTDSDGYPNICEDVVAWMPLPEPWEGEA